MNAMNSTCFQKQKEIKETNTISLIGGIHKKSMFGKEGKTRIYQPPERTPINHVTCLSLTVGK